jgi:hypothetical protein
MKFIKGLVLFCFLGGILSGCFDAPEFTNTPEISFKKIQFKETPSLGDFDTLVLYIDFKDGDGDLGLNDDFSEYPYNDSFYYIAAGSTLADTLKVSTRTVYRSSPPFTAYSLLVPFGNTSPSGKLITSKTRNNPNYSSLPVYNPASCLNYTFAEVLVPASFNAVDETYTITDTLKDQFNNSYYLVEDILFYKKNRNHYNIEIVFEYLENGEYKVFDWFKEFCIDFNGRFPVLGNINQKRPLEGTIRYAMANSSFLTLFNVKTLRLRVKIKDRSLNVSNEILTPPFTLTSIK